MKSTSLDLKNVQYPYSFLCIFLTLFSPTNVECALNHTHPSSLSLLFFHLFSIFLDAYYVGGRAHQVLGF